MAYAAFVACSLLCTFASGCRSAHRVTLTLSVAASLQDAMAEVESAYTANHPDVEFRNNFGSSGTLAREIEQGAPVDVLISAGSKPVDQLEHEGYLISGTRRNVLRNALVLIVPVGSHLAGFDGLRDPAVKLIALGDPASVPAGQYGRQTLETLRLYEAVRARLVLGKDVRQVLAYVETGNADAGLVYATDAKISAKVRVAAVAPESAHDPIVYPAAGVTGSHAEPNAREFLAFLGSPAAQAIFLRYGFTMA